MMNTLIRTSRRAAFQAAVKSSAKTSALLSRPSVVYLGRRFSTQMQMDDNEKITPLSKNQKDQLMAGYREYLDKMMEKTNKIESSMQALHETYAQKKQYTSTRTTIGWMDSSEIDRLFDESGKHKQDISTDLSELKSILQDARQDAQHYYGVDAPDGESDWHLHEEMQEIRHIIDDAAVLEDKDEVNRRHQMEAEAVKIFAVDAPDGESDGYVKDRMKEEMLEIKNIIDEAAVLEDKDEINRRHVVEAEAVKIFAVDAPDGESDGYVKEHMKEEMLEIKNIIDNAAMLEDKDEIIQRQKMSAGIYAVDAPDGDSDGHVQEELHEVQHIVEKASELKAGKTTINRKHKM